MALTLGVVFQNCSSSVNFGQGRPAAQYSGNGDSYEGKLYTHYGPCGATENAKDSQILIKPGQNFSLLSDNCQPLPSPQPVDAGTVSNLTENSLVIGDRAYYAEGVQPQIIADFTDQVGVALGQTVSSEGRIGNFSGQIAVSARTPVAQVSADGVVFARIVQVTAGQTFYIRANAPANNNETALEIANIGPLNMDWLISTLPAVTSFSTPGTFTWVRPPVGRAFKVDCWGAGGGGGSGGGAGTVGGGGGGGGFSTATFTRVTLNSSETVVVGQGGRGGNIPSASAFANGETGSPSQFGIHLAVGAGLPGIGIGNGGAGGAGGAGLTMAGQTGQSGVGGAAGGPGGAGGGVGAPGQSPGGGGGGSAGAGGGGVLGNGGGPGGVGGNGRCDVTIIP